MSKAGYSLVELLFGLVLGALISTAALKLLQAQSALARITAERARRAEALRTATQVLTAETRLLLVDRDVRAFGRDSLSLRAFRGSGWVCALDRDRAHVRYRGARAPDPAKDSLILLRDTSFEAVAALVTAFPAAGCRSAPGEHSYALATNPPLQLGDVIALFESGSYYLADGALRYRLGREGRQPVTTELFEKSRTSFSIAAADLHALLTLRSSSTTSRAALRVRLPFSPRSP